MALAEALAPGFGVGAAEALDSSTALVGTVEESMVEGFNKATGQWIGRTSQNRTLNFTHTMLPGPAGDNTLLGHYLDVRVTRAGPNSLAGEALCAV